MSQQEFGRSTGYGSDASPKSAAVVISRIETGKTDPGAKLSRLLIAVGRTEEELAHAVEQELAAPQKRSVIYRAYAGRVHIENEQRGARILAASNRAEGQLRRQLEEAEFIFNRTDDGFIMPFLEAAARIDWQSDFPRPAAPSSNSGSAIDGIRNLRATTQASIVEVLSLVAKGAIAGARVGPGVARVVFEVVQATARASTGIKISSLAGAAADNATLARLGRGALDAGGRGVAGGKLMLQGIAVMPALLLMGAAVAWKGFETRKVAGNDAIRLDAAEQLLGQLQVVLPKALAWSDEQLLIVSHAGDLGRSIHNRLTLPALTASDSSKSVSMATLPVAVRGALEAELRLASLVLDIRALPIWLDLTSMDNEELVKGQPDAAQKSGVWIRESLDLAQQELSDLDKWFQGVATGQ